MAPKTVTSPKSQKTVKAKDTSPAKSNDTKTSISTSEIVTSAILIVTLAAIASPISQLNLSPVYGSIPASIFHKRGTTFIAILSVIISKAYSKQKITTDARNWIAPFSYYVPVLQWLLFQQSSKLGPLYGPVITEALTYFPVLLLSFLSSNTLLQGLNLDKQGPLIAATPLVLSIFLFNAVESAATDFIPRIIGTTDFYTRSGLQLMVATASAVVSRSAMLAFALPAMLHTMFNNPHNYATKTTDVLNRTLSEYRYTILDRQDSLTGYLSVVENLKEGFRALRCDHSILGGEWLVTPERKQNGQEVKESIYSVFTMLEAVRMINTELFVPDEEREALFIGLGIGTAPKAFIKHGISTTIIEIDPIVHKYATKYFDLPTNHTKVISDAVSWVDAQSVKAPESYDYIVHDVFTGGAEPIPLFTYEFLKGLDSLLKEDGAIAINFAGDINLPPPRIVLNTIFAVFPSCRIFRDTLPDDAESFINMIVFCTKDVNRPVKFRKPTNEDYQGSLARRANLPPDEGYEIFLPSIGGGERKYSEIDILKKGNEKIIAEHHNEAAMRHWKVMRTVLPDGVWENW